jgi:hypothetical protein
VVEMKGGPQQERAALPVSKRRIIIAGRFGSRGFTFMLGLFGAVERQDRDGVDLGGADPGVGTIGLKLAVPEFALGFDECALLKRSGPFSKLSPDHDPMPLSSGLVFAGVLVFPTHVGCERKPGVSCPVGREASLGVFAEKADECDAILAEHFVSPFRAPSVGATESEWVLLPRARDALLGETFRGNRQSRVTRSRRAQGLTPKQSPIEEGRKARYGTAGAELQIETSTAARVQARQRIGRNLASNANWNDWSANPSIGRLPRQMVKLDGPEVLTAALNPGLEGRFTRRFEPGWTAALIDAVAHQVLKEIRRGACEGKSEGHLALTQTEARGRTMTACMLTFVIVPGMMEIA